MATRKQVREAFYTELETAASGTNVEADDIGQEYPNEPEELPAIAHTDRYRLVPMNTNTGPVDTQQGADGTEALIYSEVMEAQFMVVVVSDDEAEKESVYEAVRSHFGDFTTPVRDAEELHADIDRVEVLDADPADSESRDPPMRGDRLDITLLFERFYTRDTTPATEVQHNVDVNLDGTTDESRTTTTSS